jgi:hypothetical protein
MDQTAIKSGARDDGISTLPLIHRQLIEISDPFQKPGSQLRFATQAVEDVRA